MTETSTYPAGRLEQARGGFLRRYPDYARTTAADELRARDCQRLDRLGHAYLDCTGGRDAARRGVSPPAGRRGA